MNTLEVTPSSPATTAKAPERPVFVPSADIHETATSLVIRCEMPGVAPGDLEITLENKVLSVSGSQQTDTPENTVAHHSEYLTGIYQRTFQLNREVDEAGIRASLKNGLLEIELPKARNGQALKIPIHN